jgi:hypothetical protein
MRTYILNTIFLFFILNSTFGQNGYIEKENDSINLCGKIEDLQKLVGQKLKIYHAGGVFATSNNSDFIKWKNDEIKQKAGKSYWNSFEPKTGDIGEVIQVSLTKHNNIVYVLNINGFYVPISCSYLTETKNLDTDELFKREQDKIEEYGNGDCNFKKNGLNETFNRAGITNLDKMSESFSCELKSKGITTIMLVKKISDNGSSPYEKAFILWNDNDKGYIKKFENNIEHNPTQTEIVEYNWDDLVTFYESNKVKEETKKPESFVSHYTNLIVQLYIREEFYSFGMQLLCRKEDEKLANVKFVRLLDEKLK